MSQEDDFHREMVRLGIETARDVYPPTRFNQMVQEHGGVGTARRLLDTPDTSDGFARLWEAGRLDLTVEAVAIQDKWASLFTAEQLATARQRLTDLGYQPKP